MHTTLVHPKSFRYNTYKGHGSVHGSVDILPDESMPQAIEIIGEAEEEGLANLGGQATPRGTRGEFTFDDRKDSFDLGALPVRFFREGAVHLIANGAIGDPPALGGDDASSPQALPNVLVIGFGVKLRIRQHHANGRASCRHVQQSRQIAHVGSWPAMRPLRQQNLLLHIHHDHPLQPMAMARAAVGMLFHAPYKKGADRIIGEPGAVDSYGNGTAPASSQPAHRFAQPAVHRVVLQSAQKTIQRGVVGHGGQLQCGAQLLVFAQARLGFAKGPIFVAHQTEHRQQLRLGELMFAEARAVGRQNLRGHLQRHAGYGQESDFGHRPSCLIRKHPNPRLVDLPNESCAEDVNRASVHSKQLKPPLESTLMKDRQKHHILHNFGAI